MMLVRCRSCRKDCEVKPEEAGSYIACEHCKEPVFVPKKKRQPEPDEGEEEEEKPSRRFNIPGLVGHIFCLVLMVCGGFAVVAGFLTSLTENPLFERTVWQQMVRIESGAVVMLGGLALSLWGFIFAKTLEFFGKREQPTPRPRG